jgi:ribosomal protein S17
MGLTKRSKAFMLLAQCVPSVKQNASKIRVKRLVLDEKLVMYFGEFEYYYAHDTEKICKTADMILITATATETYKTDNTQGSRDCLSSHVEMSQILSQGRKW